MSDNQDFYRAFEDIHRGSRKLIKDRLKVYRPFVEPLLKLDAKAAAIDLGSGRGEWLELLGEIGFDAVGVELNAGMLEAAEKKGLRVEQADAIEFMERQPEASAAVVSGFHIAEHLPFSVLQSMVEQAHRVLMPGGLLILETPNPENVTVGANSFYMDPTHERPLPPALLSFLPEYYGFSRTRILRLQEQKELRDGGPDIRLLDVFEGVSPDYAVIAQKKGNKQATALLNVAFKQEHGVTLTSLAARYEDQLNNALAQNAELVRQASDRAERASDSAERASDSAERALDRAERAEAKAGRCEQSALAAEAQLAEVYSSRSWRVTEPLRWVAFQLSLLRQHGPSARAKALARKILSPIAVFLMAFLNSRPGLRKFCVITAQKLGLYDSLRTLCHGDASGELQSSSESLDELTPHGRQIYFRLRSAIDNKAGQT